MTDKDIKEEKNLYQQETINDIDNNDVNADEDKLSQEADIKDGNIKQALNEPDEEHSEHIDELHNKYLEALADKENLMKRHQKELSDLKKYFIEDTAKEMVSVMDNVCFAGDDKYDGEESFNRVLNVVRLTRKQIDKFFSKFNVEKIEAKIGDKFDYEKHHAISQKQDNTYPAETILQVIQHGYKIGDRLIRPVLVIVST